MLGLGLSIPHVAARGSRSLVAAIRSLFAANEPGVWYDPSDLSTLFQDAAGTTPVTAVEQPVGLMLDKSGNGNHASQPTATSRPVLSARVNQYLATETLATQNVTTLAAQYRLSFEGTGTITLSGTATGVYSAGSHLIACTAGTLTSTVSGSVTKADLRVANTGVNLPPYQRVNTATDYDTVGFPHYLRFDGVDDWLVTPSINFTSTNKMMVCAGVRKLSDAAGGVFAELGAVYIGGGKFGLFLPNTANNSDVGFAVSGTVGNAVVLRAGYAAPTNLVLTGIVDYAGAPGAQSGLRANGGPPAYSPSNAGAGPFGNNPLYIGRRGGTTLPFNGHLYSLIIRGAATSDSQIKSVEKYINTKTRAY